ALPISIPSTPREYTPAQVLPRAQEHSPKILQARLALESARAEWRGAVSGWLPNVFAAYSRTWQRPEADSRLWDIRWQAQLGVEWNVFNGLNQTAAWQRADGHVQGAEAALQAARAALELEVESAFSDYQQAAESLQLQAANVALAEKNRLIAEEKFSLGMLSPLELQNVQLEHAQTHWNYQQALFDHALAAAALDRLSGATDKE
ncbi:MAG: TolC family protein, partial [Candidatus Firestonebacteria bacterium]|nr:TolC family protein [Candidatus Firestonebacteria bacterium]